MPQTKEVTKSHEKRQKKVNKIQKITKNGDKKTKSHAEKVHKRVDTKVSKKRFCSFLLEKCHKNAVNRWGLKKVIKLQHKKALKSAQKSTKIP